MQIRELFDENLNPKWDYIWTLEPFKACIGVNQNKEWHREMLEEHIQNVTMHMKDVIDGNCPEWLKRTRNHWDNLMLMAAALCHDLGKASTTRWDDGLKQWKCKNHGVVGEKITRKMFFDDPDILLREGVCWLVRYHMGLHNAYDKKDNTEAVNAKIKTLSNSWKWVHPEDLAALYVCDCLGSSSVFNDNGGWKDNMAFAMEYCTQCHNLPQPEKQEKQGLAVVLVGISGSGKSTVAEEYKKEGFEVISRDTIREELGMTSVGKKFKGNKEQENEVTRLFNERLLECARNKMPFVIDNMNLIERYRKGYKELLKDYPLDWQCVYVEAPTLEDCKKRREGQMPPGEIDNMLDRLEFPRPHEFDGKIWIYKQCQSQC
jgi:predicted kinase